MNSPLSIAKRVTLRDYISREPIPFELASDQDILDGAGGTLVGDSETFKNYHLVQFRDIKTHKVIQFQLGVVNDYNPQKLSWLLHSYLIVGFNWIKYDAAVIWCGQKYCDIKRIMEVSQAAISGVWPRQLEKDYGFKIWPTNIIDLIEICPGNPPQLVGQPTRPKSLKLYMGRLHSERLQDLPFDFKADLSQDRIAVVQNYCLNDIVGTEELLLFNKDRIILREELGREYRTDLRSKSDAQMAEAMVAKEIKQKTGFWPKKADLNERRAFCYQPPAYLQFATPQLQNLLREVCETEFVAQYGSLNKPAIFEKYYFTLSETEYKFGIGGLHSHEKTISYKADVEYLIEDRDVTGYYPNILMTLGLYPKHLGPVFLEVFKKMKLDREYAKKHKLFTKDKGLKIATNGISGKLNSEFSIFYDPQCYLQMTLTGQLSILMLAEMLVCSGMRIISANTDGIVIYCKRIDYDKMLYWITYWEKMVDFKTEETRYKSYYARDVNAYFAVKEDLSVKVKGPYSEVGSQTGTKLDNNPICLICSDAVKALLAHNIPIEQTIRECSDLTRFITVRNVASPGAHKDSNYLGKVVRWYYSNKIVGTINYVATGNKVPETEGAKPCQDLPNFFPDDLNYQKYIDKTIEILYEIDYIKRPKQGKLI